MPSVARPSTSLISFVLDAVSSSSSFTRSRTGESWRWTYFLRANGFRCPQNPSRVSTFSGSLPVAFEEVEAEADWVAEDDDWKLLLSAGAAVCWEEEGAGWEAAGCWLSAGGCCGM